MGNTIESMGTIIEALPGEYYRVELDNGHVVRAPRSDEMRASSKQVMVGDRVKVEIDVNDLSNGCIIDRYK